MTDVFLLGEALGIATADHGLRHAHTARLDVGGAEFNVAIGLARLGHPTAWLGVLSADQLGERIAATLQGEGVDIADCVVDNTAPTGLMLKEALLGRITRVSYYRTGSAGSHLSPDHIPSGRIAEASILHLTGITPALSPAARDAAQVAITHARQAGTTVSLDINYRAGLWPSPQEARQVLAALTAEADIVFASEDEQQLIGEALPAIRELVITRGAKGSSAEIDGDTHHMPALNVRVVDTLGAGDAFVAGYLSGILDGLSPQDRLHRGTVLGAFAVASPSDWQGLPRRADLALFDHEDGASLR
jgi:2-dehydro-3-deoxygluconokinase